jgi:hypothetical protein
MADEEWVLSDERGNYYVLSREALERARVTGAERARVEAALRAGDDTGGFAFELISPNQTFPEPALPGVGSRLRLAGVLRGGAGHPAKPQHG